RTSEDARDTLTHARPEIARVTHMALDLALDFEEKEISGTATLDILAQPGADTIVLDSDGLRIARITDQEGNALPFEIGEHDAEMGEPVSVTMGDARQITVTYSAAPEDRKSVV